MPRIDDSALKSLELTEKAAPMPIKRVDRLIEKMESWSDEWIGADHGKIGYWEREGLFQRRLGQIRRTFIHNIILCNPNLKPTIDAVPDEQNVRGSGCRTGENDSKACSIFEAFSYVQGFERLQRDYIACPKVGTQRQTGINRRLMKLKRTIISSVCQARATSLDDLYNHKKFSVKGKGFDDLFSWKFIWKNRLIVTLLI